MNRNAVILASCLLVSMPGFSQGLIKEQLIKSKHQSFVENSNDFPDFSGLWVGQCDILKQKLTLKIAQTDKNIILSFDETGEDALKFPIKQVKSKTISSLNGAEHSLSSAFWSGPNSIGLSYYNIASGTSDHTINFSTSSYEMGLKLKNGKLKFIVDQYPEDIVCVLDKQE